MNEEFYQNIRKMVRVAIALNSSWLHQYDLAELIGITPAAFYTFMNNQYNIGYSKARKLELFLCDLLYQ